MFTLGEMAHCSTSASDHQYVNTFADSLAVKFVAVAADVLSDGWMQSELPLLFRAAVVADDLCFVAGPHGLRSYVMHVKHMWSLNFKGGHGVTYLNHCTHILPSRRSFLQEGP